MLDEMTQRNTSKFAIFLKYENLSSFFFSILCYFIFSLMNALVYVVQTVAQIEKKLHGYSKNMAKFEAFRQVISSSINFLFQCCHSCIQFLLQSLFSPLCVVNHKLYIIIVYQIIDILQYIKSHNFVSSCFSLYLRIII